MIDAASASRRERRSFVSDVETTIKLATTTLLVLAVYAPFRAIPFKPLRDLAVLQEADNFFVRWIGELPTLLADPVQSANVRARAAEAIEGDAVVIRGVGAER